VEGIAAALDAKAKAGAFDRLIVAASPRALGDFRAAASKALKAKVVREIHGDYLNGATARLFEAIDQ
jgi:protein required for attachment to host cells